jgi:hypothetical protein
MRYILLSIMLVSCGGYGDKPPEPLTVCYTNAAGEMECHGGVKEKRHGLEDDWETDLYCRQCCD